MKTLLKIALVSLLFTSVEASAQESIIGDINYTTLQKYIQAAKDYYPKRKIMQNQQDIAKADVTISNISYLDIFSASYFYRPNDQPAISAPGVTNNPYIVNGIQYGINLNLGAFLTKPFTAKKMKAQYKIAKLQAEDYDVSLESEVKKRYYTYIQKLNELKLKTQTAEDNKSVAESMRRRFEKGELPLDGYNASRVLLSESNSSKIQTEVDYLLAKDALEEIIGAKLTDIK